MATEKVWLARTLAGSTRALEGGAHARGGGGGSGGLNVNVLGAKWRGIVRVGIYLAAFFFFFSPHSLSDGVCACVSPGQHYLHAESVLNRC